MKHIYKEKRKKIKSARSFGMGWFQKEEDYYIKGSVFAKFNHKDGSEEIVTLGKNLIVKSCGILLARLMKETVSGNASAIHGAFCLAMGTGNASWDTSLPAETADQETLVSEIVRKEFSNTYYVDGDGNYTVTPTNIVDFVTTFDADEANASLREMGLFGGTATTSIDSGIMINYKTFAVINKPNTSTMTIVWRLTF